MKKIFKKIIPAVLVIVVLSSNIKVQAKTDGSYYSSKLIEGTVLTWEYTKFGYNPEPYENEPIYIEITVLKNMSDTPINLINLLEYFNATENGIYLPPVARELRISSVLFANLYIIENISYTLYEYYMMEYSHIESIEIKQKRGDVIITNDNITFYYETTVDEETGIVRESLVQFKGENIETNYKYKFIGGIELVKSDLTSIIIVITGLFTMQRLIRNKKRKINLYVS